MPAYGRVGDVTRWANRNAVFDPMVLSFEKALPVVHQLVEQGPGLSAVPVEGSPPLPESLKSVVNTNGSDSCRHATTTNDHRASRL
jgi:hypothetical protein